MNLVDDLKARGLVEHMTTGACDALNTPRTVYGGFDPSSDSLQIGNLALIITGKRLANAGHKVIFLAGGATGAIGDPREKGERPMNDLATVARNTRAIKKQFKQVFGQTPFRLVDNADWLGKERLIPFLRDVGKHFTVNELIKHDLIKRRIETPDESISVAEFFYSLLQGFDFWYLYKKYGCDFQFEGTDQWTNILSGTELIRKKEGKEANAFTIPIITDAAGKKFGKSEGNAVWLDAGKTSPFAFYQFWLNQGDDMVEKYLNFYTFIPRSDLGKLMEEHRNNPAARSAQKKLATEVTALVHGAAAAAAAARVSEVLYGTIPLASLTNGEKQQLIANAPGAKFSRRAVGATSVADALVSSGLASSKSDARRLIEGKGVSINGRAVEQADAVLSIENFENDLALLRRGKQQVAVLSIEK